MSTSLLPKDSKAVGIEHKVEDILRLLEDPTVSVIAVLGMAGLGKTFLVQDVFNRVKTWYEYSIWLPISESYSLHKLQCGIASQMGDLKDVVEIHARLKRRRSLIVLDDVWCAAREDDLIGSLGLPIGGDNQCKVVVTTRSRQVCMNLEALAYEMKFLSVDESWSLFCAHAFPDSEGNRAPQDLEEVARRVVAQCERLPLALKTVAASLSQATLPGQWESKLSQLQHRDTVNDPVMQSLKRSYDFLPQIEKSCFTFLSFFPKGKVIDCEDLVSLWIVEGLIPEGEGEGQRQRQRDSGWNCLNSLANSSLLQVGETFHLKRYCKMNGLLFDLAMYLSSEIGCVFSLEPFLKSSKGGSNSRRILLANKGIDDGTIGKASMGSAGSVCTLSLCDNKVSRIPDNFFASMKVLKILDLSSTQISGLPESITNLKLLTVLNLYRTKIEKVPNCVRYLTRLRFLNISQCESLIRLPQWIAELKYLEHLNVAGCSDELSRYMPSGISKLLSLRILTSDHINFSIQEKKVLKLEDVASLTSLEELCINVNRTEQLEDIEEGVLEELVKMRSLAIANWIPPMEFENPEELPSFPSSMKAMKDIEQLYLWNFAVPKWVCAFEKLRVIEIYGDCSDYPELETMPSLERLCLLHNRNCTAFPEAFGKCSGFPKLRFLEISTFPQLEKIPDLEDGAMQCLERLWINSCDRLQKLPDGLERLKHFKQIEVNSGSQEIGKRLQEGGEDWRKLKAVKIILSAAPTSSSS